MKTTILEPKNTIPRIEAIYAYLSVDPKDGNEGVVATTFGEIGLMPLVAADEARLKQLTPIAEALATLTKQKIILVKFTKREEIKFIAP